MVVTANARDFLELLEVELHSGLIILRESGLTRAEQRERLAAALEPGCPCATMRGMNVVIPPEFEAFAREQVKAGAFASAEEAVAIALRDYLARIEALRAAIDDGLASGEAVEGRAVFDRIEAELEARIAAEGG